VLAVALTDTLAVELPLTWTAASGAASGAFLTGTSPLFALARGTGVGFGNGLGSIKSVLLDLVWTLAVALAVTLAVLVAFVVTLALT